MTPNTSPSCEKPWVSAKHDSGALSEERRRVTKPSPWVRGASEGKQKGRKGLEDGRSGCRANTEVGHSASGNPKRVPGAPEFVQATAMLLGLNGSAGG